MMSNAVSIAALAWTPALAALPVIGKIAPILTVLSCADALPATKMEIEAAQSSPRIWLNFMLIAPKYHPMSGSEGRTRPDITARRFPNSLALQALHARLADRKSVV